MSSSASSSPSTQRPHAADADPAQIIDLLHLIDNVICWKRRPARMFRSDDPQRTADGWNAAFADQPASVNRGRIDIDGALTPVGQIASILGMAGSAQETRRKGRWAGREDVTVRPAAIEAHHLPSYHVDREDFFRSMNAIFEVKTSGPQCGEIWVRALSTQVVPSEPNPKARHKLIFAGQYAPRGKPNGDMTRAEMYAAAYERRKGRNSTAKRREKREEWEQFVWPPIAKVCWEHGIPHMNRRRRNQIEFPAVVGIGGEVDVLGMFAIQATLLRDILAGDGVRYQKGQIYDEDSGRWVPDIKVLPPDAVHYRRTMTPGEPLLPRASREARAAGVVRTSIEEGLARRKKHRGEDVPRYIPLQPRTKAAIPRVLEVDDRGWILYRTLTLGDWLWLEMNGHIKLDDLIPFDPKEWVQKWNSTRAGDVFLMPDWTSGAYVLDFPTLHYRETRRILQPQLKP